MTFFAFSAIHDQFRIIWLTIACVDILNIYIIFVFGVYLTNNNERHTVDYLPVKGVFVVSLLCFIDSLLLFICKQLIIPLKSDP